MSSDKTVLATPQQNYSGNQIQAGKSNKSKVPIIFLISALIILTGVLAYYFLIINADPKLKINIYTEGNIEQKNMNYYEILYKNTGKVIIEIEANKIPGNKEYFITVNGEKEKIDFRQDDSVIIYIKKININPSANSQYSITLSDNSGKDIYKDDFNVTIIRPNMSSREFVENYLRTYSDAFSSQSSSTLYSATAYWESGKSDILYNKLKNGFPNKVYMYYENAISMPNDDVSVKVSISNFNEVSSVYTTYSYIFKLIVIKNNNDQPEWKISDASERVEKRENYNYGRDFEGD